MCWIIVQDMRFVITTFVCCCHITAKLKVLCIVISGSNSDIMWYLVDGGPSPPSYRIEKYHHNIGWWFICYSLRQPIDTSVWLMTLHNIIKISFISHHLKNRVSNKQSCVNIIGMRCSLSSTKSMHAFALWREESYPI